ncbi:MAG: hypothetical protein JW841_17540 [Deltaproteobacteria bacterium]|nr:hypothetical protein [Deltaproteobacteria bacterium]
MSASYDLIKMTYCTCQRYNSNASKKCMQQLELALQHFDQDIEPTVNISDADSLIKTRQFQNYFCNTALSDWLCNRLDRSVRITFTCNRTTMLSFCEKRGVLVVRLHEIFTKAETTVWEALADYIEYQSRNAAQIIDKFISACPRTPAAQTNTNISTQGRFHDLRTIFNELNQTFFHNQVQVNITWGFASPRRYRRSIQLGLYLPNDRLIRIHPALDQAFVPHYYVTWIVFHEMLHDVFGIDQNRKQAVHPPELKVVEQTFPHYALCKQWEKQNLFRLLRFRKQRLKR